VAEAFDGRARVDAMYRERFASVSGIDCVTTDPSATSNHSYFPILVRPGFRVSRDELYAELRAANIYSRRYFYPLISDFSMYRGLPSAAPTNLPVARMAAEQVLCLPIFPALTEAQVDRIVGLIRGS
jgi:dTDP-4-amino-4,6-dideoxygalactose transaminase